jgi:ABC-2 type transport system ATP-binding protein
VKLRVFSRLLHAGVDPPEPQPTVAQGAAAEPIPVEHGSGALLSVSRVEVMGARRFRLSLESFEVYPGEIVALVGANGAGKSTLLETVLGLQQATMIEGKILGVPILRGGPNWRQRQRIGAVAQRTDFVGSAKVSELLRLHDAIYGTRASGVADCLNVGELASRRYATLSFGERNRLKLAMAFGHLPELLFLDEPTTGLDHRHAAAVRDLLSVEYCQGTRSALMATHLADDLAIATRIVWLRDGRVYAAGTFDSLASRFLGARKADLRFTHEQARDAALVHLISTVGGIIHTFAPKSSGQLTIFGSPKLDIEILTAFEADRTPLSYGFAPVSVADLLGLVSGRFGELET